jgi:hypothetical protein
MLSCTKQHSNLHTFSSTLSITFQRNSLEQSRYCKSEQLAYPLKPPISIAWVSENLCDKFQTHLRSYLNTRVHNHVMSWIHYLDPLNQPDKNVTSISLIYLHCHDGLSHILYGLIYQLFFSPDILTKISDTVRLTGKERESKLVFDLACRVASFSS